MPAIRGAGLSRTTFSNHEEQVEPAETRQVAYLCPRSHEFHVRLFAQAEVIPVFWDCPTCGTKARTYEPAAEEIIVKKRTGSPSKTPWEQLLERRTVAELEILLQERLAVLRGSGDGSEAA